MLRYVVDVAVLMAPKGGGQEMGSISRGCQGGYGVNLITSFSFNFGVIDNFNTESRASPHHSRSLEK